MAVRRAWLTKPVLGHSVNLGGDRENSTTRRLSMKHRLSLWCVRIVLTAGLFGPVWGQEQVPSNAATPRADDTRDRDKDAVEQPDDEKARLHKAEDHMRRLELRHTDANGGEIKLLERPLLAFGDAARIHNNGTFWACRWPRSLVGLTRAEHHRRADRGVLAVSDGHGSAQPLI